MEDIISNQAIQQATSLWLSDIFTRSIQFYQMFIVTQTMKQWITSSIFKFTSHVEKF